jgi:hypothetical protein
VVSCNGDDVLVCEYSIFEKLKAHDIQQFRTVVVDSRYPRGFLDSRLPSLPESNPTKPHSPCTMIPVELLANPFWERLVESAAKASFDCLLIENLGEAVHFFESINVTEVQCAELTALRAALVLGAHTFSSPTSSVLKRILTWGRRKARENVEPTANIMKLVQNNLLDMTRSFIFEGKQSLLEHIPLQGQGPIESEVRLCRMSPAERQDYEKCSIALRGALSSSIVRCQEGCDVRRQTLNSMAEALLRMRKQCNHSKLSALFRKQSMQTRVGLCLGTRRDKPNPSSSELENGQLVCRSLEDNPSQTDLELASQILVGSAKLRELLSILQNECNCKFEGLAAFISSSQPKAKKQSSFPKKVVILAVLPEVQILVSVLLHCVGIGHEFVKSPWSFSGQRYCDVKADVPGKHESKARVAWLECQEALARFNSPSTPGDSVARRNILIASSEVIGCDYGGIGIDMADFVISIDDDWSGRNELMIRSLVAGLCPRKQALEESCRFLSLVCEATCEEIFFSVGLNETSVSARHGEPHRPESWPWSIDARGRFIASKPTKFQSDSRRSAPLRNELKGIFAFPAENVFRWRNQSLSKILAVEKLPPCLDEGSSNLFLPCIDQDDPSSERRAEVDFVVELMLVEESARYAVEACGEMPPRQLSQYACTPAEDSPMDASITTFDKSSKQKRGDARSSRVAKTQDKLATQVVHGSAPEPEKSNRGNRRSHKDDARPVDTVACLLHYKPSKALLDHSHVNPCEIDPLAAETDISTSAEQLLLHVPIRFASAFHVSKISFDEDGKAGNEALVYLPPLAPGSLHRSTEAHHVFGLDIGPEMSEHDLDMGWLPHEPKRPAYGTERFKGDPSIVPRFDDAHASATNPFDTVMANGTTPTLGPEAPIIPHTDFMSMDLDEDFESVGAPMGITPLPNNAALLLSASLEVSNRSLDPDQLAMLWERPGAPSPCDVEELEDLRTSQDGISLASVVLVVASKRRNSSIPSATTVYRASTHLEASLNGDGSHASVSTAIYRPNSSVVQEMNGSFDPAVRTNKLKSGTLTASVSLAKASLDNASQHGSMAQPPVHYQAAAAAKARDLRKKGIFTFLSIEQKAIGRSMFESSRYRLAAVRFKNRTDDRLLRQSSAFGASLKREDTVHSFSAKVETTAMDGPAPSVQRSVSGDETESYARRQFNSRHISLQAPCLVDFGPFNGGFLQSSSGMSGSWPPMPKVGVSLPMGVKVQNTQRPQQQPRPWIKMEDRKLRLCVARFGLNWIVASRTLSDFDDSVGVDGSVHFPRTACECRKRWQELELNGHVESGKSGRPDSPGLSSASPEAASETFVLFSLNPQEGSIDGRHDAPEPSMTLLGAFDPESNFSMKNAEPNNAADPSATNASTPEKVLDRFGPVLSADSKRQIVPITIPGSTPGSQPAFVASHPSHLDAVHSSIAASWTSGRTEMWPLQFLDVAEKQRTARVSAVATASSSAISQSSSNAVSPVGSSASMPPEGSARAPPPALATRPAPSRHHSNAPSNTAGFGHHPQSLSQPYLTPHYAPPLRQASAYPPHLAPPSAARSTQHASPNGTSSTEDKSS